MSAHPDGPHGALAPGYALGALDADERQAFEAHLAGCAACRAEVRTYDETAALLAHVAPAVAAAPALRARILAEARATAQDAGREGAPGAAPAGATPNEPVPNDLVSNDRVPNDRVSNGPVAPHPTAPRLVVADGGRTGAAPAATRLTPPRAPRAPWLAAASLVLAVGLGTGWAREHAARAQAEAAFGTRSGELLGRAGAELGSEIAERRRLVAERDSLIAALTEPDVRVARLAATGEDAAMRLTWSRRRGVVVVTAAALPAPEAGRTYQLWGLTRGGAPQSLGVFRPGPDGSVRAVLRVPPGAAMELAAVTDEPAGGSPRPTSTPLMTGAIGAE